MRLIRWQCQKCSSFIFARLSVAVIACPACGSREMERRSLEKVTFSSSEKLPSQNIFTFSWPPSTDAAPMPGGDVQTGGSSIPIPSLFSGDE